MNETRLKTVVTGKPNSQSFIVYNLLYAYLKWIENQKNYETIQSEKIIISSLTKKNM